MPTLLLALSLILVPPLDEIGRIELRRCESTHNYQLVHEEYVPSNGTYQFSRGAYQFVQPTFNSALQEMQDANYAGIDNWSAYIGMEPNQAPEWVQDHAATYWWNSGHHRDWPNCSIKALAVMQSGVAVPEQAFTG